MYQLEKMDYLHLNSSQDSSVADTPISKKIDFLEGNKDLYQNYELGRWIGKGLNMVWEAINKETFEIEAIKEIQIKDNNEENRFKSEIEIREKIKLHPHPNLINYKGYYMVSQEIKDGKIKNGYIVMEKGATSLANYIKIKSENLEYFQEKNMVEFVKTMIAGHVHLEKLQIAHRDIKPENILIFFSPASLTSFKICDVGVSTVLSSSSNTTTYRTLMGTLTFLSPELLTAYKSNKRLIQYNPYKSDVYSLGLVFLYFMTFKVFLFL